MNKNYQNLYFSIIERILTVLSITLFIVLFSSCKEKSLFEEEPIKQIKTSESPYHCNTDSLTMDILAKISYHQAKKTCNLPIIDREFILNEVYLGGSSVGLNGVFSEEEMEQPIPIKYVSWDSKDREYIDVWYQEKQGGWLPIHSTKYNKSTFF